jgi:hypothetical protein
VSSRTAEFYLDYIDKQAHPYLLEMRIKSSGQCKDILSQAKETKFNGITAHEKGEKKRGDGNQRI